MQTTQEHVHVHLKEERCQTKKTKQILLTPKHIIHNNVLVHLRWSCKL